MKYYHKFICFCIERSFFFHALLSSLLFSILVFWKIKMYNFHFSSLIGIWDGFYYLNQPYFIKDQVIFQDGGYDGQFFFMNARFLFESSLSLPPILDSFSLRFSRIGLSALTGSFSFLFGFQHYGIISIILLWILHLLSSYVLKNYFSKNKYLYLIYLYSCFSWNSNLLLVSDSLLASFFIFYLASLKGIGLNLIDQKEIIYYPRNLIGYIVPFFLLTVFFLSIKEAALPIVCITIAISFHKKHIPILITQILSLCALLSFKIYIQSFQFHFEGTNPMSFIELSDYPLLGFLKSFHLENFIGLKPLFREIAKLIIFGLYVGLIFKSYSFLKINRSFYNFLLISPVLFFLGLITVAEEGYWNSFDNVSRFFTILLPYYLIIKEKNRVGEGDYIIPIVWILFIMLVFRVLLMKTAMNYYIL